MVEEKICIENEIYGLCEEIARINSDNIKKLKRIEEEKTVYINKKLDSDNLITLCRMHHDQAEKGIISKEELYELLEVTLEGR